VILVGDIGGTKATLALAHADHPLVVEDRTTVASRDHATAADLIVWKHAADTHLREAVLRAGRTLRLRMAGRIAEENLLSPWLRQAVLALLRADPPVRTVGEWAALREVACVPSTLRRRFGDELGHTGTTPKAVIRIGVLLHALETNPEKRTWSALSLAAGVDKESLRRWAEGVMHLRLRKPADLSRNDLLHSVALLIRPG